MAKKKTKDKNRLRIKKNKAKNQVKKKSITPEEAINQLLKSVKFRKYMTRKNMKLNLENDESIDRMVAYSMLHHRGLIGESIDNLPGENIIDTIECDMQTVDSKKLALIADNIKIYKLDLGRLFLKEAVVKLKFGSEYANMLFSYRSSEELLREGKETEPGVDGQLLIIIKSETGGINMVADIIDGGRDVSIDTGMTFEAFSTDSSTMVVEPDYMEHALSKAMYFLSILFYINSLATLKTAKHTHTASTRRQRQEDHLREPRSNADNVSNQILIPRKYIVKNGNLVLVNDGVRGVNQRNIDAWGVAGHWRHYKNGKKVWINPHTRGVGDVKSTKEYKIRSV